MRAGTEIVNPCMVLLKTRKKTREKMSTKIADFFLVFNFPL